MIVATITKEKKKRGFASLLNQFGESDAEARETNPAPEILPQPASLTERLNRMIAAGASFETSIDDFRISGADRLSESQKRFLSENGPAVLCTLQQALLMKHLPEGFRSDFIGEVKTRAAILPGGAEPAGIPFEIVRAVTEEWFADLLDGMTKPKTL